MRHRLRIASFGLLLALGLAAGEAAQELCAELTIPPQLDLFCSPAPGSAPGAVEIAPSGGAFSALSRMTVRPLDREDDALAWSDPAVWLRRQMTLDTSSFAGAVSGLADDPDSPFAGERAEAPGKPQERPRRGRHAAAQRLRRARGDGARPVGDALQLHRGRARPACAPAAGR